MSIRMVFLAACCLTTVITSAVALAQEVSELERQDGEILSLAKGPQRPPWEASLGVAWIPGSSIDAAGGGDLTMGELKAGFTRRVGISPRLDLFTGLQYLLRELDAPETARLPESLHALSLHLGGEYRFSDSLSLVVRISPGLSGDFRAITTDDVRVPVALHAKYRVSRGLSLMGGVAYTGHSHSIAVLPVIGALYRPSDKWAYALGFPRTGVVYKPAGESGETELSTAVEFTGGEYRLHDSTIGADVIRYRDFRAVAGIEFPILPPLKLGLSGGYAFSRKFFFYEGAREDLNLDSAPFGRLELKASW